MTEVVALEQIRECLAGLVFVQGLSLVWKVFNDMMGHR